MPEFDRDIHKERRARIMRRLCNSACERTCCDELILTLEDSYGEREIHFNYPIKGGLSFQ